MTKQTPSGPTASLFSSRGLTAAALGLVGGLALAVSGCDTVAQISFTQRGFNEVHSSGFVPAGGGLDGSVDACAGTTGDMTMRFVMTDNARQPIRLGVDQIDNQSVELTRDDVSFNESALFEIPQSETELNGVTRVREDLSCTTADGCEGPSFGCGIAPTMPNNSQYNACFTGGSLSLASGVTGERVRFVSDLERSKLFGVAYEVSGSVVGSQVALNEHPDYDPRTQQDRGLWWDQDGDGSGDISVTPVSQNRDIASDDGNVRSSSANSVLTTMIPTRNTITDDGRQIAFASWHFDESLNDAVDGQAWFTSVSGIEQSIRSLQNATRDFSPFAGTHAEVYDAAESILTDYYSDDAIQNIPGGDRMLQQGLDKVLVLVVDGPDDNRGSIDDVIQAARDNDVRVFVVHYDTGFDPEDIAQLYDKPEYLIGQLGQSCDSDDDCKNFEICRQFRGFSNSQGGSTKGVPSESYCFPQRNTNGRIGPIEDYSMLGCATGGGYTYIRSPDAITPSVGWLPYVTEGLWEVDASSDEIDDVGSNQDLLLQALFDVTVSGTNKQYQFSQVGGRATGQADSTVAETDTRAAVFSADE
jgi:hypothetical protein